MAVEREQAEEWKPVERTNDKKKMGDGRAL